jgi:signal transduction histidine kinase
VVVFQDITSLKNLDRQKDEFLATVSHDLKNPLTAISGTAQLLLRRTNRLEGQDSVRLTEGLQTLDELAKRMSHQLTHLVDSAHLEMGRPLTLDVQPTDLVAMLERLVSAYQQTTEHHTLHLDTDRRVLECNVDARRLESALTNVLANALKYSPEGGPITLSLTCGEGATGTLATLSITDRGIGIPASDLPRVFERFYRAANVLGQFEGTGLGLAGARQIIEQHGGSLAIESEQGIGTTVSIQLPLSDRQDGDGA